MKRPWNRITPEERREAIRLAAQGKTLKEIGAVIGRGISTVGRILEPYGGVIRPEMWRYSDRRLSLEERVEIKVGLEMGHSFRAIACDLKRQPSTVSREVNANGGRKSYAPMKAHLAAHVKAKRPKTTKLAANPVLCAKVAEGLQSLWSPMEISNRLKREFGDDSDMNVSHETIYKTLFVQGRGELRRELKACLRTGRAKRMHRGRLDTRGKLIDMVPISERPAEVEDRAVPGHWEGDLLMGARDNSAIGTLVERSTRFLILFELPKDRTAEEVRKAMTKAIQGLPDALKRSITWDRGREMAQHAQFTIDTGIQIYFCDPYSPWQRGSNENTNGLLRQYFPKGKSMKNYTSKEIQDAADGMNGRPRMTLDWMTPAEKLAELVAKTG